VPAKWTQRTLREELPKLLAERQLSLRTLASRVGVNQSYLSRVLGARGSRPASADIARRIAEALELPPDYFPEAREDEVVAAVRADPALRDKIYRQLRRNG
jgi:transcriptional regulator with XRE-family HTH domain